MPVTVEQMLFSTQCRGLNLLHGMVEMVLLSRETSRYIKRATQDRRGALDA